MPPNVSSTNQCHQKQCEVDQAHLECPKELQAKIVAETKALNKRLGIANKIYMKNGVFRFETEIIWKNAIAITMLHIFGVYHILTFSYMQHWKAFVWGYLMGMVGGFGVTGGAHRYWTHRSYKATVPFRILLMVCYCSAGQNSIYDWVRDHRVHHKFSETDADPHNSNRGFFFAHVGWLMLRKHSEVIRKGREIDMSDVLADPVSAFAEKYFVPLKLLLAFVLPVLIPVYLWNESWYIAIVSQWFVRYMLLLNITWSVNSAAHLWGNRPYDKNISPVENKYVSIVAMGEGWHNYHHVFPWDYKAAEFGNYNLNLTTAIIDFFAYIGWVYDRKQPSTDLIQTVITNRGDGSHRIHQEIAERQITTN
ncbi:PREDICTED: acyl-CoA Delta(11) desaturase-like [Ceratosolen solmsi marchali]|uniref:Acyl-CoA Delta(11) desaturase-like n=1 Tax=Ceratosolen solmsi marchali TaxID=326594 RepID=A0AAJ7DY49_9HYME|nr:PREDICTED: acyl-CoA Delta(11) desaturase-like [Ceratosolen solmsi marchali]